MKICMKKSNGTMTSGEGGDRVGGGNRGNCAKKMKPERRARQKAHRHTHKQTHPSGSFVLDFQKERKDVTGINLLPFCNKDENIISFKEILF